MDLIRMLRVWQKLDAQHGKIILCGVSQAVKPLALYVA
jgi:hypothetical protein